MYNETRRIWMEDVYQLCVKEGWYNKGNNEQYENFLQKAADMEYKHVTTDMLEELATDIFEHTSNGVWCEAEIQTYMYYLSKICFSVFELNPSKLPERRHQI